MAEWNQRGAPRSTGSLATIMEGHRRRHALAREDKVQLLTPRTLDNMTVRICSVLLDTALYESTYALFQATALIEFTPKSRLIARVHAVES
jgi:hypothetical protein